MKSIALAAVLAGLVGLCLGALGGGGGIIVVPALVYGLGLEAAPATVLAKMIVGSSSLGSAALHWQTDHVRLRTALMMAGMGVPGAVLGGRLAPQVPAALLLALLALLMLVTATLMLARAWRAQGTAVSADVPVAGVAVADEDGLVSEETHETNLPMSPATASAAGRWVGTLAAGTAVGFLTGLLGVGGGFLIVPALLALRLPVKDAIGTSLLIIACNCAVSLATNRYWEIPWELAAIFVACALAASVVGVHIGRRTSSGRLQVGFAVLVVILGCVMLVDVLMRLGAEAA